MSASGKTATDAGGESLPHVRTPHRVPLSAAALGMLVTATLIVLSDSISAVRTTILGTSATPEPGDALGLVMLAVGATAITAAGAAHGALFLLAGLGAALERIARVNWRIAGPLLAGCAVGWVCHGLLEETFSGRRVSTSAVSVYAPVAGSIAATLATALCVRLSLLRSDGSRVSGRLVLPLLAAAIGAVLLDATLYRGRYPSAHALLWVAAAVCCLPVGAWLPRPRPPRATALGVVGALVVGGHAWLEPLEGSQSARMMAQYDTQYLSLHYRRFYTPSEDEGDEPDAELLERFTRSHLRPAPPEAAGARAVVLLSIDALRFDRVTPATMPALSEFMRSAIRFDEAWTPYPITVGAFTASLRGMYPHPDLIDRPEARDDPAPSLTSVADAATKAGITTHAVTGFARFLRGPFAALWRGFQEVELLGRPTLHAPASRVVARAMEILDAGSESRRFLWFHFFDPHEPDAAVSDGEALGQRYDRTVSRLDRALTPLLRRLERDRVPVVIMADHGKILRERSLTPVALAEELLHIPLCVRLPGASAKVVTAPVDLTAVAATLHELLGVTPGHELHAPSLLARASADAPAVPAAAMSGFSEATVAVRFRAVRTEDGTLLQDLWARSDQFGRMTSERWTATDLGADVEHMLGSLADVHRALTRRMRERSGR